MGLFSRRQPKIKVQTSKRDGFSGWLKCTSCTELIHVNELEANDNCCPKCDFHYRLSASDRIKSLADKDSFTELFTHLKPTDSLEFVDSQSYPDRLAKAQASSKRDDSIYVGTCTMNKIPTALAVMDFSFMGGSMGSVLGERLTLLIEYALEHKMPLVVVSSSGGARMQESILSLMQMAKTSAALAKLDEARIPFISILTNPTSGGVTASFASLGDIIIAEPGALICFAGPRVIEQCIGHKLPPGAQKSEFLLQHGMIDCIIHRKDMRKKVAEFVEFFSGNEQDVRDVSCKSLESCKAQESVDSLPAKLRELMALPDDNPEAQAST
ncbi:MAG: acetyl-CoA carboxylase carboxyl transferase subunit beta [Waddliaceae bacterium]|nr:acetyl-CoA carboxylase carboxyl transferase subunit beta [Waddliaceae bacterium]